MLGWLYSVLTKDHYDPRQTYHDPNRTYYDVASALAQYPSLLPRTDVYTFENGFSALLLRLVGTLPVAFRGTVYNFPVSLWIPNVYPLEPPIVYVTPAQDMVVRVGQHVTLEGRVYHHYLAHWAEAWDKSSITDFLSILREVFAKEPPVRYKQSQIQRPQQPVQVQAPPPLPPLPPELSSTNPTLSPRASQTPPRSPQPPPPPPKPGQELSVEQPRPTVRGPDKSPPPLPPLPPKKQAYGQPSLQHHATPDMSGNRMSQYLPERTSNMSGTMSPPHWPPQQQQPAVHPAPAYSQGPVYRGRGPAAPASPVANSPSGPSTAAYGPEQALQSSLVQQFPGSYQKFQQTHAQYQQSQPQQTPQPLQNEQRLLAQQPAATHRAETPDLLTSPFELELPSFAPSGPVPPIPPNPEKDALLHAISKTLAETLQSNASQSKSAAQSLLSQSQSLQAAAVTLQGEIATMDNLKSTLQSNTAILQESLRRADTVIADAQVRISSPIPLTAGAESSAAATDGRRGGLPPIDDVLVAPTVVGKQLYDLVAEEYGIEQAIYALQSALVKGVIGVDTWSRHTRGLAREAFLKRALIRKIGKGMGLEESS